MSNISTIYLNNTAYNIKDSNLTNTVANLATVASSGEYSDLLNTPTIPNTTNMQTTTNMVDTITNTSTNTTYPTASAVYNIVGDIESILDAIIAQGS